MRFNSKWILSLLVAVPSVLAYGEACYYNGLPGHCMSEGSNPSCDDWNGYFVTGQCKGPSYYKCCVYRKTCSYQGKTGECLHKSYCPSKTHKRITGLCPGNESIQCCLKK